MTLSASIMAHPTREHYVTELLDALDGDAPVSWDRVREASSAGEQRWMTGRGAWELHDLDADWHVVLQDDALVCEDFIAGFANALDHLPPEVLVASAYCGTKRPDQMIFTNMAKQARKQDASWLRSPRVGFGVAIACRTDTIEDMLAWCDGRIGKPYDLRIDEYFRNERGSDCFYTWPSLVDHRDESSLIAYRDDPGRHAREFHAGSALELSWDGPVVDDPRMRRRELMRARAKVQV